MISLLSCSVDPKINRSDFGEDNNLYTNLLFFQFSSDVEFYPASGNVSTELTKIAIRFKYEISSFNKDDIILYNNNNLLDFELTKLNDKNYEIRFFGGEGKYSVDLTKLKSNYNLSIPLETPYWILDEKLPTVVESSKFQSVHYVDLSEGNISLSFSEAVVGAEDLSNYEFTLSDPQEIQIVKILKSDELNYKLFVQSYSTKPLSILIKPIGVTDYANHKISNETVSVKVYGFRQVGSLVEARCDFSAIAIDEENILISGGINSGIISNTLEIYNVNKETSRLLSSTLSNPIFYHKSFKLKNGKVLLVGGYENSYSPSAVAKYGIVSANAYLYDPIDESVVIGASLNTPRTNFASVQMTDGSVVITGGMTVVSSTTADLRYSNVIEVLGPQSNTFATSSLVLPTTLHSHSAVETPDGKVVVFGGLVDRLDTSTGYNFTLTKLDINTQTSTSPKILQNNYIESFSSLYGNSIVMGSGMRSSIVQIYNLENNTVSTVGGFEKALGQGLFSKDERYNSILSGISGNNSASALDKVVHFDTKFKSFKSGIQIPEPKFCNATVTIGKKHYIIGGATNFSGYIKMAGGLNLANSSSKTVWVYETK